MTHGNKYKPIKETHVSPQWEEACNFLKYQIRVANKRWRRASSYKPPSYYQWGFHWHDYLMEEDLNAYEDKARTLWTGRYDPYFY